MKRIYLIATLLLAAACSEKDVLLTAPSEKGSSVIPVQEALDLVIKHSKILYPETRSNLELRVSDATTLTKDVILPATRANDYPEIPDTTLYIFNFPNNSGYAVTSANRKYGNTLFCLTESGSLTLEDFSPAKTRAAGDSTGTGNEGNDFIADLITATIMSNEIAPPIDSLEIGGGPGGIIGPFLKTKWGQSESPFNDKIDSNYPAGCIPVAIAQIMAFEEYSSSLVFDGITCSWSDMKTVYTYPNTYYSGSNTGKNQVASFLKELGKSSNCDISYHADGSSGHDWNAKKTLKNYGYKNVTMTPSVHIPSISFTHSMKSKVRNQLFGGHPVYVGGMRHANDGHAWVVDGYYAGLYHINWGWMGMHDGYFNEGVFCTTDRVSTSSIDPGTVSGKSHNYSFGYFIITYDIPD